MSIIRSFSIALLASGCVGVCDAAAVTAEVAKKCDTLVAKAFPPRIPGNPAAGTLNGSVRDQRDYFAKCLANGGNMDNSAAKPDDSAAKAKDAK